MKNSPADDARALTERFVSCGLMLVAAAVCVVGWMVTGTATYLVIGAGFIVLAPLWYRSPVCFKALRGPLGGRLTPRRQFSPLDMLLTFFGYGLVLIGIGLRVFVQ